MPPDEDDRGKPRNPDSGPLYGNLVKGIGQDEEAVCGGCQKNGTRPGRYPPHLTHALARAAYFDKLRAGGASFPYPTALSGPYEWMILAASAEGRRRADEARNKRTEDKRKREAEEERQRQLTHGGGRRPGR